MQSEGDGLAHQRMIGRMKIDDVDASALSVMRPQLWRFGVGKTRRLLCLTGTDEAAKLLQVPPDRLGEGFRQLHQQRVGAPGIGARRRRALVCHLVRHVAFSGQACAAAVTLTVKPAGFARENPVDEGQVACGGLTACL